MSVIMRSPKARDGGGAGYLWRGLTPTQARAIRDAYRAGVPVPQLADQYGVHRRSIYRALKVADQPVRIVTIDGWTAQYVIGDEGPIRMTAWYPA